MVSEILDNVDLVLGDKTFVELEGERSMRELRFMFLNRSLPIFPMHNEMINLKERRHVKIKAPFLCEISGLGKIKNEINHK